MESSDIKTTSETVFSRVMAKKRSYLVLMDVLLQKEYYFRLTKPKVTFGFRKVEDIDIVIPERDKLGIDLTRAPLFWEEEPKFTMTFDEGLKKWKATTCFSCNLRRIVYRAGMFGQRYSWHLQDICGKPLENETCFHFAFSAPYEKRAWDRLRFWFIEMSNAQYEAVMTKRRLRSDLRHTLYDLPTEILGKIAGHLPKETMLDTLAMVSPLLLPKLIGQVRWPELICDGTLDSLRIGDLSAVGAVRTIKFCTGFEEMGKVNDTIFEAWFERLPRFLNAKNTPRTCTIGSEPVDLAQPNPELVHLGMFDVFGDIDALGFLDDENDDFNV